MLSCYSKGIFTRPVFTATPESKSVVVNTNGLVTVTHCENSSTCLKSQQSSLYYHWLLFTFEIHWLSIHLVDRWAYLFSLAHNKNKTAAMWAIFCLQWWCNFFSKNYFRIASAQRKSCVATLQQVMWQLKNFQKKNMRNSMSWFFLQQNYARLWNLCSHHCMPATQLFNRNCIIVATKNCLCSCSWLFCWWAFQEFHQMVGRAFNHSNRGLMACTYNMFVFQIAVQVWKPDLMTVYSRLWWGMTTKKKTCIRDELSWLKSVSDDKIRSCYFTHV